MQGPDATLPEIRRLAETALQEADLPASVTKTLREIVALTKSAPGDTPELSDPPHTENQTL